MDLSCFTIFVFNAYYLISLWNISYKSNYVLLFSQAPYTVSNMLSEIEIISKSGLDGGVSGDFVLKAIIKNFKTLLPPGLPDDDQFSVAWRSSAYLREVKMP